MQNESLKTETKEILIQLMDSIHQLTIDEYTERISLLSNATIGEHTRHIIELFQQLFSGYQDGIVNYDNRKRDLRLQESIDFATDCIANIVVELCKENKDLKIVSLYINQEAIIHSNYERELMYNLEHCIHHQAIIKIGLVSLNRFDVDENFGVAKSTIVHKKESELYI